MGMIDAQEGSVRVFGLDPRIEPMEVKRRVGYVSEEQILPPQLRVDAVIALHKSLFPTWDDELARGMIERFSIPGQQKIKTLSKGQARQVALLCASPTVPSCWSSMSPLAAWTLRPDASFWRPRSGCSTKAAPRFSSPRTT